jgi:hypothetical protein
MMSLSRGEGNLPPELLRSFRGFFDLRLPDSMVIRGVSLHQANGETWLEPPMSCYKSADGSSSCWIRNVEFESFGTCRDFIREALAAIAATLIDDTASIQ